MELLIVAAGGAAGAVARYAVGVVVDVAVGDRAFPWATLLVNALGSFVLGLVLFGTADATVSLLVGAGFCGAFTTYSSFSYQTVALWERAGPPAAVANALGNLVASLVAFGAAWLVV